MGGRAIAPNGDGQGRGLRTFPLKPIGVGETSGLECFGAFLVDPSGLTEVDVDPGDFVLLGQPKTRTRIAYAPITEQ